MVAQNNGKIYKVQNIAGDKIYIGSTNKKYLSQRMDTHRSGYKRWKAGKEEGKIYSYDIFEEFGIENCVILLIESYPCGSKDELRAREGHYIQTLKCVNKNIAGRKVIKRIIETDEEKQIREKYEEDLPRKQLIWDEIIKRGEKIPTNDVDERNMYENSKPGKRGRKFIIFGVKTDKPIQYEEVAVIDDQNNIMTVLDV